MAQAKPKSGDKLFDASPKRGTSTRFVKRDPQGQFATRGKASRQAPEPPGSKMPPPGPSNIIVTTANPLPAPKKIGSE